MDDKALIPAIAFSEAKAKLSELLTEVVFGHTPRAIERHRGKERAVLLRPDDLLTLLEAEHRLPVEAAVEKDAVTVTIKEPSLLGFGSTVTEAMEDLGQELERYVADYIERFGFYLQTDRVRHAAAVLRLALTPREQWLRLLLSDSQASSDQPAQPVERRGQAPPEPPPALPLWVLTVLTDELHMSQPEIARLSPDEAIEIVHRHWSRPMDERHRERSPSSARCRRR